MEIETINFLYKNIIINFINFICSYKASVPPLLISWFLMERTVAFILIFSLIAFISLVFFCQSLEFWIFLVRIKVPHFLNPQDGLNFQKWDTIRFSFIETNISLILVLYLLLLLAILALARKENKIDKERQKRLYIWYPLNITCLLALSAMLDGGSILELARWLKYDDLANFLKEEPILCHIFLLAVSSLISKILLAFYDGYQYIKNKLITEKGITAFKVVHLTLFFFLPILFFGLYLGQPWPVVAKVYLYQFSWFIESLSYDQMVFVVTVMMGFLPVISVIVGRQVREKPAKELWEYLVALVFGIYVALRLDYLLLMILDASFVNNLLLVLVNLGILVTIPLGTLPIRLLAIMRFSPIMSFNEIPEIRDLHMGAQQIFNDRIPSRPFQIEQGPVMPPEAAVSLPELDAFQIEQGPVRMGSQLPVGVFKDRIPSRLSQIEQGPVMPPEAAVSLPELDAFQIKQDPVIMRPQRPVGVFKDRILSRLSQIEQGPVMPPEAAVSLPELDAFQIKQDPVIMRPQRPVPSFPLSLEERDAAKQARDQLSLDISPRPQREKDFIESEMGITTFPSEYQKVLPSKTDSLAPLRWAIDDMSHRMRRSGLSIFIPKWDLNFFNILNHIDGPYWISTTVEIKKPKSWDLWTHLIGQRYSRLTWFYAKNEVSWLELLLKHDINFIHDWGHDMKIIKSQNILLTNLYLTVLLQGRIPENLFSLSENVQGKVKQIIAELENSPNLLHYILFRERLANVSNIFFSKGQGSLAHAIEIPIASVRLPVLPLSFVQKPLALQSLAILKSMYDGNDSRGYIPVYDSIISMDDCRYTACLYRLRHFDFDWLEGQTNILQIPKKIVASDVRVQRGYDINLSVVDSQLGPEGQLGMLNQISTTLNESLQWEQDLSKGQLRRVKNAFKETVLQEKKRIKTFLKYESAVFDKSHCKEWVERLNECNKKQLQSINDCRQKRIIQLALLEKGMGDLLGDVIENRDLKLKLVPVLKEIVNQLRSSQTRTAMDLSTP